METANKFKEGQVVFSKKDPAVKLIIRRYYSRIYYCRFADAPELQEVALFEREIMDQLDK